MSHPLFARGYAKRSAARAPLEAPHRRELLAGLKGRVLEIGCGHGLNFPYYPPEVTAVVGLEPEPYLRRCADAAARHRPGVTVVDGTAEGVSTATGGPFDAVVFSLVLCSVTDPGLVLRRVKTVLRDGADVRCYEHVLSDDRRLRRAQHLLSPLWAVGFGGCRPNRDLLALIGGEFELLTVRRFDLDAGRWSPDRMVAPHLLVAARLAHGAPG